MKQLARHRDFRLLFAGHVTSLFGDRALFVVLGIWALELTGSTGAGGIAFGFLAVAGFLAPIAGVIADRFPRRHVLIGNDLATAVIVLALLFVNDSGDVWIIYAVALIYGFSQQVGAAARSGLVAGMLPDELLAQANGVLESARSGIRIAAPVAGAGLYVLSGGGLVAIVDAGTFVISAAALSLVRAPDIARAKRGPRAHERAPRRVPALLHHAGVARHPAGRRLRRGRSGPGRGHPLRRRARRTSSTRRVPGRARRVPRRGRDRRRPRRGQVHRPRGRGAIARARARARSRRHGVVRIRDGRERTARLAAVRLLPGRGDRQLDDADPAEHADGAARTRRGRGRGARLHALRRRHRPRLRARDDGRLPCADDRGRRAASRSRASTSCARPCCARARAHTPQAVAPP